MSNTTLRRAAELGLPIVHSVDAVAMVKSGEGLFTEDHFFEYQGKKYVVSDEAEIRGRWGEAK